MAHIRADEMYNSDAFFSICRTFSLANLGKHRYCRAYRDSWYQTTSLDVPYALCIRPGANNPYNTSTCGLVAGDEESYSAFESTFDGVIEALHGEWGEGRRHVSALDPLDYQFQMRKTELNPSYVLSCRVRAARNLSGHRFPTACSAEERRTIEKLATRALRMLKGDMQGSYFPLHGSNSYRKMHGGMSAEAQDQLLTTHLLFRKPSSAMELAGGFHREWPDARGVFTNVAKEVVVWVNSTDHMRLMATRVGPDIQSAFLRFCELHAALELAVKAQHLDFLKTDRYGYISANPREIGTSLRATVLVRLPKLSQIPEFNELVGNLHLECFADTIPGPLPAGQFVIGNSDRLRTDLQLVNCLIDGVDKLIQMEQALERGSKINNQLFAIRNAHDNENIYPKTPPFPEHKCPDTIPDLIDHHNLLARALRAHPAAYHRYKAMTTQSGVPFARCLKTGVDVKGMPGTRMCGLVAGDEECYSLFREVFDPVIEMRHGFPRGAKHTTDLDAESVRSVELDPDGRYIYSVQLRTSRNIRGYRLPPACDQKQRRKVESIVVKALLGAGEDHHDDEKDGFEADPGLVGKYFPLLGSTSYPPKPKGMTADECVDIKKNHMLFEEPNSEQLVAGGFHHEWPDARGVFYNTDRDVLAWVNQEDHVRLFAMEMGSDIKGVFERLSTLLAGFERRLEKGGKEVMRDERLGYITTDPGNVGTGLRVRLLMRLPQLVCRDDFAELMKKLKLDCTEGEDGMVDLSNADRLGRTEVELANVVIHAAERIIAMETALEHGNYLRAASIEKEISAAAATDSVYGSSHFPEDDCPMKLPDLTLHKNALACVLKGTPSLYTEHREVVTAGGVGLGRLIKPGMHHEGVERMSGIVAGDEDSYRAFARLFDPVIESLHPPFRRTPAHLADRHVSNFNAARLLDTPIDPKGSCVISSRIRAARNVRGFPLPPACDADTRRDLELKIIDGLEHLRGGIHGDYFPLSGSESFPARPGGMEAEHEAALRSANLLFLEPTTPVLIAGGYHRDWPEARGMFANDEQDFMVWVNEKDHMRIIATEEGSDLQHAFSRFCAAIVQVEECLQTVGLEWMHSDQLGYLTTDPANLGTGLRASLMMRLPLLTKRRDFMDLVTRLRLEARPAGSLDQWETTGDFPKLFGETGSTSAFQNTGASFDNPEEDDDEEDEEDTEDEEDDEDEEDGGLRSGGGAVCIGNLDRLGRTEVELVNLVIYGAAQLVKMEELLQDGLPLEPLLAEMEVTAERARHSYAYVFSSEHSTLARQPEAATAVTVRAASPSRVPGDSKEKAPEKEDVETVDVPAIYAAPPPTMQAKGAGEGEGEEKSKACLVQ